MRHSKVRLFKTVVVMYLASFISACAISNASVTPPDHTDAPKPAVTVQYPEDDGINPMLGQRVVGISLSKTF